VDLSRRRFLGTAAAVPAAAVLFGELPKGQKIEEVSLSHVETHDKEWLFRWWEVTGWAKNDPKRPGCWTYGRYTFDTIEEVKRAIRWFEKVAEKNRKGRGSTSLDPYEFLGDGITTGIRSSNMLIATPNDLQWDRWFDDKREEGPRGGWAFRMDEERRATFSKGTFLVAIFRKGKLVTRT